MAHRIGRYLLHREIAAGGMATVHLGRVLGEAGFVRTVAIKRLHPHLAREREFLDMFVDEARLAARIRHPNVVSTIDVVRDDAELLIVMEYVAGESLARILKAVTRDSDRVPPDVASAIVCDALHGLHAAHEATDAEGGPLEIVHRDVSPQNILVSSDGIARMIDFGVAKAVGRLHTTRDGQVKGKLAYMAPEQLLGERVDRRTDVFAVGVVLWETLTGERLFAAGNDGSTVRNVLDKEIPRPSTAVPTLSPALDQAVLKALRRDPRQRFSSALEMATILERTVGVASPRRVAEWLSNYVSDTLSERRDFVAAMEREPAPGVVVAEVTPTSPTEESKTRRSPTFIVAAGVVVTGVVALAIVAPWRGSGEHAAVSGGNDTPPTASTTALASADTALASAAPTTTASASTTSSSRVAPSATARATARASTTATVTPRTTAPPSASAPHADCPRRVTDDAGFIHWLPCP